MTAERPRPYHHGNLRTALLRAAIEAIARDGPAGVSLRGLARQVGVSHAAPVHHFGDKAGLLTAVAVEGYRMLAAEMGSAWEATGSLLDVGVAYVRFAVTHRAHFEVMFQHDLLRSEDPDLRAAQTATRDLLRTAATTVEDAADGDVDMAALAGWALMHGVTALWSGGLLPADSGTDPVGLARRLGALLFQAAGTASDQEPAAGPTGRGDARTAQPPGACA